VVVGEEVPDDMEPAANKQRYYNRKTRTDCDSAQGEESVTVRIREGGDDGSANLVKYPECQETHRQAEHQTAKYGMGEVFPIIDTSGQIRSEAADDE